MKNLVILGAGPAGLGGAFKVAASAKARVTVLERNEFLGGNAGTINWEGHRLDFGSHRLHWACDPKILAEIQHFLGEDLLDRPRHGRIRLLGKWVHFPLKPGDLLLHLDKRFALGTLSNMVSKFWPKAAPAEENFATVLERSLGSTICRHFYFPYARKIWGRDPLALSAIQARRRVSAGSFGKLLRKVLSAVPGFKKPGSGRFYYPRRGFGAISDAYGQAAQQAGADLQLSTRVTALEVPLTAEEAWTIKVQNQSGHSELKADILWSTIPITKVAELVRPAAPVAVQEAASRIEYRAMVLAYLELDVPQFTEYDAHYFPGEDTVMTRLSEPKNYPARTEPAGRTVLCAELPCAVGDTVWTKSDAELGELVADDLARSGLPLKSAPIRVFSARMPQAYPIYRTGYEAHFDLLDQWADSLPRFLTYGRQGLFAHDNTHHALAMAYAAAECLSTDGQFDMNSWHRHRSEFARHVVED